MSQLGKELAFSEVRDEVDGVQEVANVCLNKFEQMCPRIGLARTFVFDFLDSRRFVSNPVHFVPSNRIICPRTIP